MIGDTIWMFPKNRGIPKWMVKKMENPIKMDDLGVPLFLETPIWLHNKSPPARHFQSINLKSSP